MPLLQPIDEQTHDPSGRLAAGLQLDQVEARVPNVGFGQCPQILYVLSHLFRFRFGFVGSDLFGRKKSGLAGPPL
jgi:hypothetical protein